MAAGDVTFSEAVDGVCVPCCFTCATVPDTFDIVVSGVDPCGCVSDTEVTSSAPALFTLTKIADNFWQSDLTGSTDVYSPCDTFLSAAKWRAIATCAGGVLTLIIQIELDDFPTAVSAFFGDFVSGVATNTNLCSDPGIIVGGGFATYTP